MKKLLLLLGLIVLASCAITGNTIYEETITIGVLGPFTGPVAFFGEYTRQGYELAREEINAAGGINGRPIEFIYEDTECINIKKTLTALQKLQRIDKVVGVLGPFCGGTNTLAGDYSFQEDFFVLSPGDNLGKQSPYKFNTRYFIHREAEHLANYALSQGYSRAGIIYYNNEWGLAYRDSLKKHMQEGGGDLVAFESYTYADIDVRSQLLKLQQADIDALLVVDALTGELFTQVRELDIDVPLLSEWEIQTADMDAYAQVLEGVVIAFPTVQQTPVWNRFTEKYGKEPNVINLDSYDAMKLFARAVELCPEQEVSCMAKTITSLENYSGAGGTLAFDTELWGFNKPIEMHIIQNGKIVALE